MKGSRFLALFVGFAIFSMFFGSGNIVFPLNVGIVSKEFILSGIFGFLFTGTIVPFSGVMAVLYFKGDHEAFLSRIGHKASFLITTLFMILVGPFGVIPRCVTLSHATFKAISPDTTLFNFALISSILILVLSYKKKFVIDILGKILTPILLSALMLLVVKGVIAGNKTDHLLNLNLVFDPTSFWFGLVSGYQTMDLVASFYFSSFVYYSLKVKVGEGKILIRKGLFASFIGGTFLAFIYFSLGLLANFNRESLQGVPQEELLGRLSLLILGKEAGVVANIVASFAALTTAISLMTVFVSYVHEELFKEKLNAKLILIVSSVITFIFSNFNFENIMSVLGPIVEVFYPALIVLNLCNLLFYFFKFKYVKTPFYLTLIISLIYKISSFF